MKYNEGEAYQMQLMCAWFPNAARSIPASFQRAQGDGIMLMVTN